MKKVIIGAVLGAVLGSMAFAHFLGTAFLASYVAVICGALGALVASEVKK